MMGRDVRCGHRLLTGAPRCVPGERTKPSPGICQPGQPGRDPEPIRSHPAEAGYDLNGTPRGVVHRDRRSDIAQIRPWRTIQPHRRFIDPTPPPATHRWLCSRRSQNQALKTRTTTIDDFYSPWPATSAWTSNRRTEYEQARTCGILHHYLESVSGSTRTRRLPTWFSINSITMPAPSHHHSPEMLGPVDM